MDVRACRLPSTATGAKASFADIRHIKSAGLCGRDVRYGRRDQVLVRRPGGRNAVPLLLTMPNCCLASARGRKRLRHFRWQYHRDRRRDRLGSGSNLDDFTICLVHRFTAPVSDRCRHDGLHHRQNFIPLTVGLQREHRQHVMQNPDPSMNVRRSISVARWSGIHAGAS